MIVLGLDPSPSNVGWAVYHVEKGVLSHGTILVESLGGLYLDIHQRLAVLELDGVFVNVIALEMPVYTKSPKTYCKQCEVIGVLKAAADDWYAKLVEVYPSERRKATGLSFKGMSAQEAKDAIMDWANRTYGLEITSDHESDAVAVAVAAARKG